MICADSLFDVNGLLASVAIDMRDGIKATVETIAAANALRAAASTATPEVLR